MNEHKPLILYAKNEKGKYVPFSQYEAIDYWRAGSYLVDIKPGCTSIRNKLYTPRAANAVLIVVRRLADKIIERMAELEREPVVPTKQRLTKKQREAWEAWKKAFKTDRVWYRSRNDIVEDAMQLVVDEIAKENR